MKFKTIYNADGIKTLKNNQFINFDILNKHVIPEVYLSMSKSPVSKSVLVYIRDDLYGKIFIDNGYLEDNKYYPIVRMGRYSHMYGLHLTDYVDLTSVYPELENRDFVLNENTLKNLVVAQLRKSYPMAVWPDPKLYIIRDRGSNP